MLQYRIILEDQAIDAQLLSDGLNPFLGIVHRKALRHRICNFIIETGRRYDRFIRMLFFLRRHSGIQIDSQLQIQTIIQTRNIKAVVSGLVVKDLYIACISIICNIQTVDFAVQRRIGKVMERQLVVCRAKIPLHKLVGKAVKGRF